MSKLFAQADAFLRECFAACTHDGFQIDDADKNAVIAEAHRKLDSRMFRPDRIGEIGGPTNASRDDRIRYIVAYTVLEMGLRPPPETFTQLMGGQAVNKQASLA